jgi:ATP-dependent DNA helicase PIF1
MVDGDLFDKLAIIGGIIRKKKDIPFGGIQIIVTGDFFQLPPVTKGGEVKFAFEAEWWGKTVKKTFNLTKVFRQKDQGLFPCALLLHYKRFYTATEFVDMLNEMRFGALSPRSIQKFKSLSRSIEYQDGLGPTELYDLIISMLLGVTDLI